MEPIAIIAVVVGLAAAIGAALRRPADRMARTAPAPRTTSADEEQAELDALFASTVADYDGSRSALLAARLRPVIQRRVPVSSVVAAPVPRTARINFADGTTVIARGYRTGDLGQLSVSVLTHPPVWLESIRMVDDTTRIEFVLSPSRRLAALAVGLDQSD